MDCEIPVCESNPTTSLERSWRVDHWHERWQCQLSLRSANLYPHYTEARRAAERGLCCHTLCAQSATDRLLQNNNNNNNNNIKKKEKQ